MIDCVRFLLAVIEDEVNAFDFITQRLYMLKLIGCVDVHMCDLVVSYGEGVARARVKQFKVLFGAHLKQPRLAQLAVDVNRIVDGLDAVLTEKNDSNTLGVEVVDKFADDGVDLAHVDRDIRMMRAEFLKAVIKVR